MAVPTLSPTEPAFRWIVGERIPNAEGLLVDALGIPELLAAVLVNRNLNDPEEANRFLNPRLEDLHDPRLLPDFEPALGAILEAKERNELIFIHGDYDVDGVTSTALFSRFLSKIGCRVHTHIPNRLTDGYGVHLEAVSAAKDLGAKLLLTCDCGISAVEEVEAAREMGMNVVVTDHHTHGATLPRAHAVVNPHRPDSKYPFAELSGAGVVLKLCAGITEAIGHPVEAFYRAYLDLAALGTIADVMPLVGENRIIAHFGLPLLLGSKKPGIRALLRESKLAERAATGLRTHHVSFGLGPRLNAAGRIEDAVFALELLLTQDDDEASRLARKIEELNEQRKSEQDRLVEEAIQQVIETGQADNPVIVVAGDHWHPGVIGIVASKVVERFNRPAFVGSVDPVTGRLKASGRSIPGFHLADAIRARTDLMEGGGHAMAAGFSANSDQVDALRMAFAEFASGKLTQEDFFPKVSVECVAELSELHLKTVESLARLEPCGMDNKEPLFSLRGIRIAGIRETKNPDHPQVVLQLPDGKQVISPAFGMGRRLQGVQAGFDADAVIQPSVDEWQGQKRVKWVLKDFGAVGAQ